MLNIDRISTGIARGCAVMLIAVLAACGGSGHSNDGGSGGTTGGETTGGETTGGTTGGETTGGTTGGETTGGTTGGETTGGGTTGGGTTGGESSCADQYSPEKAAADYASSGTACKPLAGSVCPVANNTNLLQREPLPCDGVTVNNYTVTAAGFTSDYFALNGVSSGFEAIYVGLHYLLANNGAFSNIVRLPELAKARKVLVLAPQAPSLTPLVTLSRWPTGTALDLTSVDDTIAWLKAVVADARRRYGVGNTVPVYVAGLSNGAVMSYLFACSDPEVSAVLAVSSDANPSSFTTTCSAAHPLGSVIVHGTADTTTPYDGLPLSLTLPIPEIHQHFNTIDGCSSADASAQVDNYFDALDVSISYTPADTCAYRNFLVTVNDGGHNWPGYDHDVNIGNVLFGAHTANFDATLQGYDLLKLAAGH